MIRRHALSVLVVFSCVLAWPVIAQADFGIVPGSVTVTALNRDGTVDSQASSHPYSYTVDFAFNTEGAGHTEGGEVRDILADLPSGFAGYPLVGPRCTRQEFDEGIVPGCSPASQVGVLHANVPGIGSVAGPIYNLAPPPGIVAQLGFSVNNLNALQDASVRTEEGYGLAIDANAIPIELTSVEETIWGVPGDSGHDSERGVNALEEHGPPLPYIGPKLPFLTLPASCSAPSVITIKADSKLAPGLFIEESGVSRDAGGNPAALTGCDAIPFSPMISAQPTSRLAQSPTGVGFELTLPNQGLLSPEGVAETEPVKAEVVLPQGMVINPSSATGQGVCSPSQYAAETAKLLPGQGCPESSKVATLAAHTPLLEEPVEGSVYLAAPHDNPFNSLIGLYIVGRAAERGILVKQAGVVRLDPGTGRLTASFDGLPPLPYSSFDLNFREGPRAPLVTPQSCGTYSTVADLYPFSDPGAATMRTAPFKITSGAGEGRCVNAESEEPNTPVFASGTTVPVAGAYSPFVFRVKRAEGDQRFSSLQATLPSGLLARLAGTPYCPESGIAIASSRTQEGGGAEEISSPSCPASSEVGVVTVAAGAGPTPFVAPGHAYLAGPYKGAPLSLEIITPAVAGPFDLGSVAVRTALRVDPFTAQVSATSDPLPSILHGIPLNIRTISLELNRSNFTLNPTNCSQETVAGSLMTLAGQSASLSTPFEVGGCKGLGFAPALKLSLKGSTKRAGHPGLKAVLTYPKGSGYANIARAQVNLPRSEFIDQGNLNKTCTKPVLLAGQCPTKSIYGKARAWTPLLGEPLEGPVYLVGGFGYKLPALVAELDGQIRVLLVGKVDTGKNHGIRNTFEAVPDAPVEKFVLELKGGKKYSLLENSENLCKKTQRAIARFTAQSGAVKQWNPPITNQCGKKGKK